jgi:DNA-binding transcriptional LysR family regulator
MLGASRLLGHAVAVRLGRLPDSELVARRAGDIRWVVCASPDYLAARGNPSDPAELSNHDCIALEGLQHYREWPFVDANGSPHQVRISPRFSANTAEGVTGAPLRGSGSPACCAFLMAS